MKKQNDTFLNIGFSLIVLLLVGLLSFAIINTIDKERQCTESGGTYVTNAEYDNCIK